MNFVFKNIERHKNFSRRNLKNKTVINFYNLKKKKKGIICKCNKKNNGNLYNWDFIFIDIFFDLLGMISIFFLCYFFYKILKYIFI